MNICMILDGRDFETDDRVRSEASRLARDEHHVLVVCDHAPDRASRETINGVEIVRLSGEPPSLRFFNQLCGALLLFRPEWFVALYRLHRELAFDAFHIHDLPLARTVLALARAVGRPAVLDLHENYPVLMQSFGSAQPGRVQQLKKRLFYGSARWTRYERKALSKAEHVIVVVEEARDRVMGLGVPRDRATIVSNTLRDEFISLPGNDPVLASTYSDRFVISYLGSLSRSIRIDTAIRAMPAILEEIPHAHLLVVGEIEARPECHRLVRELGLAAHVTFESWQPAGRVPAYLYVSDVGILPLTPDEQWNTTISNKLFQYMFARRPVVVPECAPMERVVSGAGCGIVARGSASDPGELARAIIRLARDPDERARMGRRGREAVLSEYRWTADGDRLSSLYAKLASAV